MAKTEYPIIRIHNSETGETVDREMTKDEHAAWLLQKEAEKQWLADKELKNQEKAALLARLGLTEDELQIILG